MGTSVLGLLADGRRGENPEELVMEGGGEEGG